MDSLNLEEVAEMDVSDLDKKDAKELVKHIIYQIMFVDYPTDYSEMDGREHMLKHFPELLIQAGHVRDGYPTYSQVSVHNHSWEINNRMWHNRSGIAFSALKHDWMLTTKALSVSVKAMERDPGAVNDLMAVLKRRAQMMGYDAPQQLVLSEGNGQDTIFTEQDRKRIRAARDDAEDFENQLLADTLEGDYELLTGKKAKLVEVEEPTIIEGELAE